MAPSMTHTGMVTIHATPMLAPFLGSPRDMAFSALGEGPEFNDMNPKKSPLAAESAKLDWSDIDRADAEGVSHLLWKGERPILENLPGTSV